jgi:membrane protein YdbS with pleckstrin-like domain
MPWPPAVRPVWEACGVSTPHPAPETPVALRDPAHQVSPTARTLWAVGAAIRSVVVVGALVMVDVMGWFGVRWWMYVLVVVAGVAYTVLMPVIRYRVHRWESTETAVYTQVGWLGRERRVAPMSKVQTVDLDQSAVARALGLASVTVTTASASGPLQISGIDKQIADRLVADLTRRTEREAGDAT